VETVLGHIGGILELSPGERTEIRGLVRAVLDESSRQEEDPFLAGLKDILLRHKDDINELLRLQKVVIQIRNSLLCVLPVFPEDRFHKADILMGEIIQREQALLQLKHRQQSLALLSIVEKLGRTLDLDTLLGMINRELVANAGIKTLFLALYPESLYRDGSVPHELPKMLSLRIAVRNGVDLLKEKGPVDYPAHELIPHKLLPKSRRFTFVVHPLFYMEDQYGILVFEYGDFGATLYNTLWQKICASMKSSHLFSALNKAELKLLSAKDELERSNEKLNQISQMDDLTGLLNRRGFLSQGARNLDLSNHTKQSGHLFFADLDGLKKINDMYGHKEGDEAIIRAAAILRKTFRSTDLISRLGGDEFTVLTVDTTEPLARSLWERLAEYTAEYNRSSGKPYTISLSMGTISFHYPHEYTIGKLLKEADLELYEQKRRKAKKG
jgi:diguanylate cyclase (GGDEF)-like protein